MENIFFYLPVGAKIYTICLAFALGMCMGSFTNCAAIRICRGESMKGRSHCASCEHTLSALELIPVFSWLFLKGKCRWCGEKISPRYPISELVAGLVFTTVVIRFGFSVKTIQFLILASITMCAVFADLEDMIIPDKLIIAGILCRIVFILLSGDFLHTALSSVVGGLSISLPLLLISLIMDRILKKESMGGGDIKLLFMLGLYFTWKVNLSAFILSCIVGIVFGVMMSRKKSGGQFPFGPAIAIGSWSAMLWGEKIINWYLGLF